MSANQSLIIAANELDNILTGPVSVLDVRSAEDYAAGHIYGSHRLEPALLNRAEAPVGGLLPNADDVARWATQLGLTLDSPIVVYDGGKATPAARAVWVLNAYGFNQVRWLNGGLSAWQASDLPITPEPTPPPAPVTPELTAADLSYNSAMVLNNESLMDRFSSSNSGSPQIKPIDARSAGEFAGSDVRSERGGHMPGAVHVEWLSMLQADGTLKPDDELLAVLNQNAIDKDTPTLVYCQSHQRSALTYVVLKHLGFEEVAALDGAWSSWGNDPNTPIER